MKTVCAAAVLSLPGTLSLPAGAQNNPEAEVEAVVPDGPLRGTMLSAQGFNVPAVVIIPGSGPTDRDGNNPLGVKAGYLKMLAEALAAKGVTSIRIDKRGLFGSAGTFPDPNAVSFADYAVDVLAWGDVATEKAGTGCAWLIGHSEGGLVALLAGQRARPEALCGLVLVATPGRPLGDVLRKQLQANPANAPLLPDALSVLGALERGDKVDVSGLHPALQQMFAPSLQDFLIDALSHDPAELIAQIRLPVLIVQGDNDLQVSPLDAELLSQAQPAGKLFIVPGMNHVLKLPSEAGAAANFATYGDPALPLAPGLAEAIAGFVTAR